MASIGDNLKEAREKKKLSWENIYKEIKIHPRILKALEEDNCDQFLSFVYAKAFLKKYAQYLGLDNRKMAEVYQFLHFPDTASEPSSIFSPEKKKKVKIGHPRWGRLFKVLLIAVLTLLFIGYLRFVLRSLSSIRSEAPTLQQNRRKLKSSPGITSAEIPPKNIKQTREMLVAKDKPLILTIKALRDSWMQVKSDGRVVFENVLSIGKEEKWIAREKIELWVGNAEDLQLILNGKKLGSPGKGVIKGILITREGMKVK